MSQMGHHRRPRPCPREVWSYPNCRHDRAFVAEENARTQGRNAEDKYASEIHAMLI